MRKPLIPNRITRLATSIGAKVLLEPEFGFVGRIVFPNGKIAFFRNSNMNLNLQASVKIAKDKAYTAFFLRELGYNIPTEQTFFRDDFNSVLNTKRSLEDGIQYARTLGFPVVVKPLDRSGGFSVAKVHNEAQFREAATHIFARNRVMIVQDFFQGSDYRIVVLDDEMVAAYQRIPLSITGDGTSTIRTLIKEKQELLQLQLRNAYINLEDKRLTYRLEEQGLTLESILPLGKQSKILDIANLSAGGTAIDWTEQIHPSFAQLAIDITHDMGLRFCGVDIMTHNICQPIDTQEHVVIEINSALSMENFATLGEAQNQRVDSVYLKVLEKMASPQ